MLPWWPLRLASCRLLRRALFVSEQKAREVELVRQQKNEKAEVLRELNV